MKKEYLNCQFLEVKVNEEDDYFVFEGYASTFGNVDRGGDIVVKGAFQKTISELAKKAVPIANTNYKKLMPVLWQHNWDSPIGSYVEMREDEKGLFVKGILPRDDDFVKGRVIPQMKAGSVSDMSIGYIVDSEEYNKDTRLLKAITLYETSLVTIPMNPDANITGFKSIVAYQNLPLADKQTSWDSASAVKRVREFTDSEETPSASYKKAFLWFDSEDKENFGTYKLPIADVVDGKLTAIPRAIFAAAAALRGARGGVDIPENERSGVISNINKYYDKLGMDSPFNETSSFRIDDVSAYSERELESLLKEGVSFSNKTAKTILSVLKDIGERDAKANSQRDAEIKASLEKLLSTFK